MMLYPGVRCIVYRATDGTIVSALDLDVVSTEDEIVDSISDLRREFEQGAVVRIVLHGCPCCWSRCPGSIEETVSAI